MSYDWRERPIIIEKNSKPFPSRRSYYLLDPIESRWNHIQTLTLLTLQRFNPSTIQRKKLNWLQHRNYNCRSMNRLIVVSNRLPFALDSTGEDLWTVTPATGGLVSAIEPVLRERGGTWIDCPGIECKTPRVPLTK